MVIQNAEVAMTSKGSYSVSTKVDMQVNQKPVFKIGEITFDGEDDFLKSLNYTMDQNNEIKEVDDTTTGETISSNRLARMQAMNYLLKLLLLSRIFDEDKDFNSLLSDIMSKGMGYEKTTTITYNYTENQELTYSAEGTALTADGRRLDFNYGFTLAESFSEEYKSVETTFSKFIDPLVINLNDSPTKLSNQMFYFDLDGDGENEELHHLVQGAGLLALDKNEDGEINDGTELFGPNTGNGFEELAVFDDDKNGWIDENDPIFNKLRIWSMNESGEMELYTLAESDVGAIYLGRVKSEFIDHDDEHKARGAIRESGLFLHESDGHAGGVQHVDFAT